MHALGELAASSTGSQFPMVFSSAFERPSRQVRRPERKPRYEHSMGGNGTPGGTEALAAETSKAADDKDQE